MLSIRRTKFTGAICACLFVVAASCTSSSPAPAGKVLRIGVDLPLSGRESRAATPALNGIRFFLQTHPTLDGFRVALDARDDAAGGSPDPERGASNVNRFLSDATVLAMIGPFDAAVARKEIPIANSAGLAMVTPATGNPCLTRDVFVPAPLNPAGTPISCKAAGLPSASDLRPEHANNFFRLTVTDDLQGAAAADFAFTNLHVVRAAVISDRESYGQGLATAFTARLRKLGGSVVGRLSIDPATSTDAQAFLAAMNADGAQAVYYGGAASGGCAIRAQMAPLFPAGEATPFLGGDGIAHDPHCVRAAGHDAAGLYATVPIVDASSLPGARPAVRDFKAAFGSASDYGLYTMIAYDATAILYAALDQAVRAAGGQLPTRAQVLAGLTRISGLAGATGSLGFDAAGDTTNRVVSVFEAPASDTRAAWRLAGRVNYSARLPY
jgi:branched-chain amino acid transport system substrate-binding protein